MSYSKEVGKLAEMVTQNGKLDPPIVFGMVKLKDLGIDDDSLDELLNEFSQGGWFTEGLSPDSSLQAFTDAWHANED
jgi:hypothetical protein